VAEVLVSASLELKNEGFRFTEITNINHPEVITVGDAVRFLSGQEALTSPQKPLGKSGL
jgi:hypothetical protein